MTRGSIAAGIGLATLVCASFFVAPAHGATTTSGPVTYVTAKSELAAGGADTVLAACPGETSISGGGGAFTSSPDIIDGVEMSSLFPGDGLDLGSVPDDYYAVTGVVDAAAGTRDLRATAICLEPSDDPLALTYASETSSVGAGGSSTAAFVSCSSGELTSGGFEAATVNVEDVELERLGLGFDGNTLNPDGSTLSFTKENAAFNYTEFAVCSPDKMKHVYRAQVVFGGRQTIKVKCPAKHRVVGGGFGSFPADTVASEPYDSKDKNTAPEDGWRFKLRSSGGGPQAMYATASCLKN